MEPLPTRISFFRGQREYWRNGLPGYKALRMRQPWPGVDLVLRAEDAGLRAQLELQPGAALDRVAFELEGAGAGELETASLDTSGALRVDGSSGPLLRLGGAGSSLAVEAGPIERQDVAKRIRAFGGDALASGVGPSGSFIEYLSFVGGDALDASFDIVVDAAGNSYFCGATSSPESSFPDGGGMAGHTAPFTEFAGSTNAFVVKIAPADLPHPTAEPSTTPSPAPSATPTDEPIGPPPTAEPTERPSGWTLWIPRLDLRP